MSIIPEKDVNGLADRFQFHIIKIGLATFHFVNVL